MRYDFKGNVIHAGQAPGLPLEQTRKLPAVAFWQVASGGADLLFNQVSIVEQPFAGRGNAVIFPDCMGQEAQCVKQDAFIFPKPGAQAVWQVRRIDLVRCGKEVPVPIHLLDAEELSAQQRLNGHIGLDALPAEQPKCGAQNHGKQ